MKDGDLMTHFNKIADEMRGIKPFEDLWKNFMASCAFMM